MVDEHYRRELDKKEVRKVSEYFQGVANPFQLSGKNGEGLLLDEEGAPFAFLGSSYVRIECSGGLRNVIIEGIEKVLGN